MAVEPKLFESRICEHLPGVEVTTESREDGIVVVVKHGMRYAAALLYYKDPRFGEDTTVLPGDYLAEVYSPVLIDALSKEA